MIGLGVNIFKNAVIATRNVHMFAWDGGFSLVVWLGREFSSEIMIKISNAVPQARLVLSFV